MPRRRIWGQRLVVLLLAGFAALSGKIKLESVCNAINAKFSGKIAQGNVAAATEAFEIVRSHVENTRQEVAHA